MSTTPRNIRQPLPPAQTRIKRITLPLRTLVLPIWAPLMRQTLPQLLHEALPGHQPLQQLLGPLAPEDAAVLLARAAHAADAVHGHGHGGGEALEDEVERLHPEGDGGVDLAGRGADVDALGDAILGAEVAVKVDFGFRDDF